MNTFYRFEADAILIFHALIVLFNVGALPIIWFGHFRDWRFVRNFSFRAIHLLLIGYVAAETVLGKICPLTTWEDQLRAKAGLDARYQDGCIAFWVHRLMFYDIDERFFTVGYVLFFTLVLATLLWIRPRAPKWRKRRGTAG